MFTWLEKNPFFFAVGVFVVISFAGLVTIVPAFMQSSRPVVGTAPSSVLELAGRAVYIKESCNACHSQLIRPFKSETDRYGEYSLSGEYAYHRPFLWGSKRTGPDLLRVGNYRTSDWHANHMYEPAAIVNGSIMPAYKHTFTNVANVETAYAEAVTVNKVFNVPYNKSIPMRDGSTKVVPLADTWEGAQAKAIADAKIIAKQMRWNTIKADSIKSVDDIPEIVALVAYLNSLK